jgi:hypothetical protein
MKRFLLGFPLFLILLLSTGCSSSNISNVPSDFTFILDVKSARDFEGCPVKVNIRIDANGKGQYETYDTDCAIEYDTNNMVTYLHSRVMDKGQFKLSTTQLEELWTSINENDFFSLTDDYRMAMGFSFAFIAVEADSKKHMVDNIGTEVPEIRAIVEATDAIMPEGINLDYGEGYLP